MYVKVQFKSGKTAEILKKEYEANKDKDYIVGLVEDQKEAEPVSENKELKKTTKKK